jgi:hypothetical protein
MRLALRAEIALATAILGPAAAFLLSYLRTLRKITEEPDIMPAPHAAPFGCRALEPLGSQQSCISASGHFSEAASIG